ncbi:phospholipase D family protein [Musicola keenii]|uniref:phospholipase D family nuclease n=1 Tax=Musicola keenii TaxID=2884250 RepID=UPI00177C2F18|nr:phospholipase D family protein [Musicola keenii]
MSTPRLMSCTWLLALLPLAAGAASPSVQAGFSPEGSAQILVLETIRNAKLSIRMMAYNFSAPDVIKALADAQKRGVDVRIVIDEQANLSGASLAAKNLLVNAGVKLRTNNHYKIQHDKVMVVDRRIVQTGSFNYTASAEKHNSENVLVIRSPALAKTYLVHWQSRWAQGSDWHSTY